MLKDTDGSKFYHWGPISEGRRLNTGVLVED